MFFFVLLINMMRSRVPNHIQAVPESASERDMRIRTVANPAGSVVPEPRASTLPAGWGGRVGRQTDKAAGSRAAGSRRYVLPAVCPSPSSPAPVGKQRPHRQVPALAGAPSPGVRLPNPRQGRDRWLTASSGPRWSQDVLVTVVLIGRGCPGFRGRRLGFLLLLHAAAQGQDAVVQGCIQLARVLGTGLGQAEGVAGRKSSWSGWLLPPSDGIP